MLAPLDRAFNSAVLHIASRLFPTGFDVKPDAPDTFDKLTAHVARTGRMAVWDGASDRTIFGDPEVNYAFRAWHDWCHVKGAFPFTPEGEANAAEMQKSHIRALYGDGEIGRRFCGLVDAEVNGQLRYAASHNGAFPTDQRGFVAAYLTAPEMAATADF